MIASDHATAEVPVGALEAAVRADDEPFARLALDVGSPAAQEPHEEPLRTARFPARVAGVAHRARVTLVPSLIVPGVVATGLAQLLVNRLIALHGSARTMLVNYLLPGFALVYGVTLLGEPLTTAKLGGLGLILVGVTLASGLLLRGRRVRYTGLESRTPPATTRP
jgi:hypothetical protein